MKNVDKKHGHWGPINNNGSPFISGKNPYEFPNLEILKTLLKSGGSLYFIAIFIYVE